MASRKAIAVRRLSALARIREILGIGTENLGKDPALAEARLLDRIADALEARPDLADLGAAIRQATDAELAAVPGLGAATVKRIRAAMSEEAGE